MLLTFKTKNRVFFIENDATGHGRDGKTLEDSVDEMAIYFLETSGTECLRPRQACAVESAAIANPEMPVHLRMASEVPPGKPEADEGEGLERHCITMDLIRAFPNVRIIREELTKHLADTPLESLITEMVQSEYSYQHMSDAVRVALLHKLGGIYLDLDVVVLRSLGNFRNAAGHVFIDGQSSVENGLLAFDRGNNFLSFLMRYMKQAYKPHDRSVIGPTALTRAFRLYCQHSSTKINDSIHEYSCYKGTKVNLYNSSTFNPIGYMERETFFRDKFAFSDVSLLANSYSVHVYGSGHGAHVPENSLFAYLAKSYCPSVYREHLRGAYVF